MAGNAENHIIPVPEETGRGERTCKGEAAMIVMEGRKGICSDHNPKPVKITATMETGLLNAVPGLRCDNCGRSETTDQKG